MAPSLPHVLLVENDPAQADVLTACMNGLGVIPVGPATTAAEAEALYVATELNLVVIDGNQAPLSDSVELAQHLLKRRTTPMIFLTRTVNEAAIVRRAIPRQVMCVTKPYQPAYLQRVIQMVLAKNSLPHHEPPLAEASAVFGAGLPSPHLFVRDHGMLIRLEATLIACVETEGKYCIITMASGHRHTARVPLRELLELLQPAYFVRTHRSWMVNVQYIEHIDPVAGTIHLMSGAEVPLGRAHREAFFKQLRLID